MSIVPLGRSTWPAPVKETVPPGSAGAGVEDEAGARTRVPDESAGLEGDGAGRIQRQRRGCRPDDTGRLAIDAAFQDDVA